MAISRLRRAGRTLDAFPDRIDIRDWPYKPTLAPLPDVLVNCSRVPSILDQGQEGACTGFALAASINFLLRQRGLRREVSPRMLYEMARCYDEWPGENYDGSSARGAMKGWARHGVAERKVWADAMHGRGHLDAKIAANALEHPVGAYYRVNHREVRDVHAALFEVGIVYCTLMVHDGWDDPGPEVVTVNDGGKKRTIPVIARKGRAPDGHAIALVGYTREGFIVQNSWGPSWGRDGFAILPYEDFLLHSTDVWVGQLGVPLNVDLWSKKGRTADSTSGRQRGAQQIPLADIRPYVVDVGNNGELSQTGDYWTSEKDLERLFLESIPEEAKKRGWQKKRLMLYLHGGLNSEADAASRVIAFRDTCLENGIYPLHVMWETGGVETLGHIIGDLFTKADERAGGVRAGSARDVVDRMLELTASPIGGPMWSEMKENARRASDPRRDKGAVNLMRQYAIDSLAQASEAERKSWEVHVVAHSAGSIFFAHAVDALCGLGIPLETVQFLAPAIRVDEFKDCVLPAIAQGACPRPTMYVLTEDQEERDTVGPYGKSLLWLVSNAFEDKRETPILGMSAFLKKDAKAKAAFAEIIESAGRGAKGAECTSETHGGFDNDVATMNATLTRILGKKPKVPFDERTLDY